MGASKSCFIACPSMDSIQTMLELIKEKLSKEGIEAFIAVEERAYGQDIFCTKICGKIIESQFCIVILDDRIEKNKYFPNPNVYYEYGMMTSLGKHIIPLQKDGQKLAFNIQSHDTIKYSETNLSAELDRAIKDAIKTTEEVRTGKKTPKHRKDIILRNIELNGYKKMNTYRWFLGDDIDDTVLTGFSAPDGKSYLLLSIVTDTARFKTLITDMAVVSRRLQTRIDDFETDNADKKREMEDEMKMQEIRDKEMVRTRTGHMRAAEFMAYGQRKLMNAIEENTRRIELIKASSFAAIVSDDAQEVADKINVEYSKMVEGTLNLPVYVGNDREITIQEQDLTFREPSL